MECFSPSPVLEAYPRNESRIPDKALLRHFCIPATSSAQPFLGQLAKRAGNGEWCAGSLCSQRGRSASGLGGYGGAAEVKSN